MHHGLEEVHLIVKGYKQKIPKLVCIRQAKLHACTCTTRKQMAANYPVLVIDLQMLHHPCKKREYRSYVKFYTVFQACMELSNVKIYLPEHDTCSTFPNIKL